MNIKEQEQLLKTVKETVGKTSNDNNIDIVKLTSIKSELDKIKNNKDVDPLSLFKTLKENFEKTIEAAPMLESTIRPNLNNINRIIKELTEKEKI
jgi:hypothetical protein